MAWVDTTDVAILVVFAAAVFYYFSRGKKSTPAPTPSPLKKQDSKATSSSSLKISSNTGGLNGKMNKQKKDVVIFYGSQTGTAEDYANRLAREGKQYGFESMVADLEEYELSELADLEPNKLVIFAVATYGEGEPTDNAQEAFKFLSEGEQEPDLFKNVRYTVFGLGNKTYEHYNEMGKFFDTKLEALGATRVFELGLGDDDGSLEEDYITWRDKMWPAVGSYFGKEADQNAKASRQYSFQELDPTTLDLDRVFKGQIGKLPKPGAIQTSPPYDLKNPYMAEVVLSKELMKGGQRNCMHLEVKIKDTPLNYQNGDHLGIFPQNDPEYVERLGKRLGVNLDQIFTMVALDASAPKKHPFPCPTSYRTALSHYLDIHSICRTHILKALIEFTSDEQEKQKIQRLISAEGKEEIAKFLVADGRGILEVLEEFPSAAPPPDLLFELLPRLQCRYYSISSSPEVHPETISITAVVANYVTASGRYGKGVCTNYLFNMKNPELQTYRIPVFVRRSNFKLPKVLTKPIIMVGPGTGVAPFRGFIEERAKKRAEGKTTGPNVLFYGCRRREEDFLYQEELEEYQKNGDLELFVAFSRETEKKVYVQHLIAEQKKLIWGYLEQGANIYVCGDAKNMARDVNKTLQDIVKELGGKTDDQAVQFVKNLRSSGRYLEDVWS